MGCSLAICLSALAALVISVGESAAGAESTAGPRITVVCPVSADTLAVTIRHGQVTPGRQEPYRPQAGDQLKPFRYHNWLERGGKAIGTLVGVKKDILYLAPKFEDQPLDDDWAGRADHYRLRCTSGDDPAFGRPVQATSVYRKARVTDLVRTDAHNVEGPREHLIYLTWPSPLRNGSSYELQLIDHQPTLAGFSYRHEPRKQRSEAVHVSQVGFRPDDRPKIAFLSLWRGDGGGFRYAAGLPFELIRIRDDASVFKGKATLALGADQPEMPGKVNHNGADVWQLDFSAFSEPGEYRVYVEQVGCSYSFPIAEDVWQKAWWISARGLYHQRSGIAIGPPYSDFVRPRPFHPADGVVVQLSKAAYVEAGRPSNPEALFARLAEGATGQTTQDAWGGYMDAGDFDRRAEHLVASRYLLDLLKAYPAFASVNLHIPESGNALPDMLDESLWGLDCYRRMQQPDGSVCGGIESAEHPRYGETSWQESHPIYRYAPDPWATAVYAATAAKAAGALRSYDRKLADVYEQSALAAMNFLEKQQADDKLKDYDSRVRDGCNLAAAELYALTGDVRWDKIFKATTAFTEAQGRTSKWEKFDQGEAIFTYLLLPENSTDRTIRKWGKHAVMNEADQLITAGRDTAFGWTGSPAVRIGWGRLTSPRHAIPLIYAYRLSGERKYLEAMVRACLYATGANPLNLCFTTGVGQAWPEHVFQGDAIVTNQAIPPGLTPLGPQEWMLLNKWWLNPYVKAYPELKHWPACEAYIDAGMFTITCEPTIHNSISPTFYMWGHLAGRPAGNTQDH